MTSFRVEGLRELQRNIDSFDRSTRKRILRNGLTRTGTELIRLIKVELPENLTTVEKPFFPENATGEKARKEQQIGKLMKKSIKKKNKTFTNTQTVITAVGVKFNVRDARFSKFPAGFWALQVVNGEEEFEQDDFISRALVTNVDQLQKEMEKEIREEVKKEINKLALKGVR